ncbi:MAG: DUF885 family protein [Acidobacteriota bacterium]
MKLTRARFAFCAANLLLSLALVVPCSAQVPAADPYASELRATIEQFTADLKTLDRTYPLELSATRHQRMTDLLTAAKASLAAIDFDKLSRNGQIDYLLLRNHLEKQQASVELEQRRATEVEPIIPFYRTIVELEESRRRMQVAEPQAVGQRLADLAKAIDAARTSTVRSTAKKAVVNRAALQVTSLRETLKSWYAFYDGYDPIFTWWVENPYSRVDQSLDSYARALRETAGTQSGAIIGDPVGRQALLDDLSANMIPYTPEELLTLARKELAWCEQEMMKASREMGYGDDWHKALEVVKTRFVAPGQQPELVRRLAEEAIQFVTTRNLVTIPPLAREDWWEEMLSPERQLTSPFFLGGDLILVASPTGAMTQEQKLMTLRGNNEHFARSVVFHELIPGHHLQGFMSERYRVYREPFATPFWSEGNSFYWELLLWDLNFPRGPEDRIGMLFWHMHRAARIIFSLSFHLEQMTAEDCVNFLVERVGFERFNAEAEVRRSIDGSYEPIYQSAYMLGALQFYALHKELVDSGKMSNRDFHDAILKENSIPVELIRADLTGQPLTRDYRSTWRFYDLNGK